MGGWMAGWMDSFTQPTYYKPAACSHLSGAGLSGRIRYGLGLRQSVEWWSCLPWLICQGGGGSCEEFDGWFAHEMKKKGM
jgi:hypothetical protein